MSSQLDHAPEKKAESRIVYRIVVSEEDNPEKAKKGKSKRVVCTYHNGDRVHGNAHGQAHPVIVISAREQDEVLWTGIDPFEVGLKLSLGVGEVSSGAVADIPFYRTDWKASLGRDGIYRLVSGPLNPKKLTKGRVEYKYTVTKLGKNDMPDPDSDPVDPHIIMEP